jgi:hypothetical protein
MDVKYEGSYKKRASTFEVVSPMENNNLPEVGRNGQKEIPLNFIILMQS